MRMYRNTKTIRYEVRWCPISPGFIKYLNRDTTAADDEEEIFINNNNK